MPVKKLVFAAFCLIFGSAASNLADDITTRMNASAKSLSRKRRYLIFPEGSSLQLVFCFTMPSLGMGDIFTVGSTVALAWELPHDPFVPFRRPSELLHRIDKPEKKTSGGWTLKNSKFPVAVTFQKTYYNPFLFNKVPALGYSTISQKLTAVKNRTNTNRGNNLNQRGQATGWTIKQAIQPSKNQAITTYLHPIYHKVYRRTRRDLYGRIEKLFTALSKDGRACLLKAVCEVSKATRERGTFIEEIIKAIFRVRHEQDTGNEEKDKYDLAANKQHNCTQAYPSCEHSIWSGLFFPS